MVPKIRMVVVFGEKLEKGDWERFLECSSVPSLDIVVVTWVCSLRDNSLRLSLIICELSVKVRFHYKIQYTQMPKPTSNQLNQNL